MELLEQQVRIQYKLLGHEGFWTRVRYDDKQGSEKGSERLIFGVEELIKWARPLCGRFNLYISRNPFNKDGTVAGIKSFTADLDPVREPKDRAATENEWNNAIRLGAEIRSWFDNSGVLCTSGNGALLIVQFENLVRDVDSYTQQAQQFERELIQKFSTSEVRIDATNYAKALVKLLGSWSTKGDPKLHRYARTVGPVLFRGSDRILQRIRASKSTAIPERHIQLEVGNYKSRSEADYALAVVLQRNGLDAAATLKALEEHSQRHDKYGIERDFQRIVNKLYGSATGPGVSVVNNSSQQPNLWTPNDGLNVGRSGPAGQMLPTGFQWLDSKLFGGYGPGRVYALEAPTNIGKSAFVVQAAFNITKLGKRVLFVATEMDVREFCERSYALGTGLPASTVLCQDATGQLQKPVARFVEEFKSYSIYVHYTTSPKTEEIEKLIEQVKPDIVMWDYFQHFDTGVEHRQTMLGNLARWYESAALKFNIPFLVAAQLHERFDFKSRSRLPAMKDDIKDCRVLNDTSKVVMVLDWDKESVQSEDGPVTATLTVAKNKGPMGSTKILLNRRIPRFEEL